MPRGIAAFVFVASLVFSMSILGGTLGYYATMDLDTDIDGQNEDVEQAANELSSIEFGEGRASAILQGPLAVVTPVVDMFMTLVTVLKNTSGVLQLLYGLPAGVADTIELMFRIAMLVTVGYVIRSGSPV